MTNTDSTPASSAPTPVLVDVTYSPTLGAFADAFAKAQGEMTSAKKEAANPFFKSRYADLASVVDAVRPALSKNGIAVIQIPTNGAAGAVGINTWFVHKSGEFMRGTLFIRPKADDPQAAGSAITYARRYALQAMAGIAPDDDDGEAAMGRHDTAKPAQSSQAAKTTPAAQASAKTTAPAAGLAAAPSKPLTTWITDASLQRLEGFRRTEEGEKTVQTLLSHWKITSFEQLTEAEAQKAITWISSELKASGQAATAAKTGTSNNQAA